MTRYSDIFTPTNGVFAIMASKTGVFEALFENTPNTPEYLDAYAYTKFAGRTLLPCITADNAEAILTPLFFANLQKWQTVKNALATPVEVGSVKTVEKTVGNEDHTDTEDTTDTDSEKAYNSADFVESGKTARTQEQARKRQYDQTKTTTRQVEDVQRAINEAVDAANKYNFVDIVLNEIINNITLSVYED